MRVINTEDAAGENPLRATFERLQARRWEVARTSAKERIARLERLRRIMVERREALAQALHEDFRKPRAEVEATEMLPTLMEIAHTVKHLSRWMKPRRVGTPVLLTGTRSEVRPEPKGVVLILAPWNYPFQLLLCPLVAAVAAGNCVLLKPSEKTPHTSAFLEALIRDVFDPDEVALVQGGAEVADALLELPFDHIFFTGSPRVGRKVMAAAARHLAGVTLELGGKSPAVVDASADVKAAAERIAWGKFLNGGQTCVAPDYVFVHASQEESFLAALKDTLEAFYGKTEEARRESPDFSRLVDEGAFARLHRMLERTVAAGARVAVGGTVDAATRCVTPTVLVDVKPDAPVMEEEIFGPLLPVLRYERLEDVVQHIRAGTKPLAMYIFSHDREAVESLLSQTSAGGTCVNTTVVHLAHPELPFGGIGESGLGSYHGEHGFRTFSHERAVLRQGPLSFLHYFFPPYTARSRKLQQLASRLFE